MKSTERTVGMTKQAGMMTQAIVKISAGTMKNSEASRIGEKKTSATGSRSAIVMEDEEESSLASPAIRSKNI